MAAVGAHEAAERHDRHALVGLEPRADLGVAHHQVPRLARALRSTQAGGQRGSPFDDGRTER